MGKVDGTSTSGFETARVALRGGEVDVVRIDGDDALAPLVFLHEGLGSIGLWRDFPQSVADATGRAATVYSRFGYGRSDPFPWPRGPDYMHREALEALPELLDALAIEEPVLVGHSDGASIALIYAGQSGRRVAALVLLAPHVFVEEESIAAIEAAHETFSTTDLPDRMAKHHDDAEATFRHWNDTWRSPEFRDWNIEDVLPEDRGADPRRAGLGRPVRHRRSGGRDRAGCIGTGRDGRPRGVRPLAASRARR